MEELWMSRHLQTVDELKDEAVEERWRRDGGEEEAMNEPWMRQSMTTEKGMVRCGCAKGTYEKVVIMK